MSEETSLAAETEPEGAPQFQVIRKKIITPHRPKSVQRPEGEPHTRDSADEDWQFVEETEAG